MRTINKQKMYIKMKKPIKWMVLTSNIFVSSLFLNNQIIVQASDTKIEQFNNDDESLYYRIYKQIYNGITDIDEEYESLFLNGIVTINGKEYFVKDIVLVIDIENNIHVVKSGKYDYFDLIKNEKYSIKNDYGVEFNKSTVFSKLYDDGLFGDGKLEISQNIIDNYINSWDGKKSVRTRSEIAEKEANKEYVRRKK